MCAKQFRYVPEYMYSGVEILFARLPLAEYFQPPFICLHRPCMPPLRRRTSLQKALRFATRGQKSLGRTGVSLGALNFETSGFLPQAIPKVRQNQKTICPQAASRNPTQTSALVENNDKCTKLLERAQEIPQSERENQEHEQT